MPRISAKVKKIKNSKNPMVLGQSEAMQEMISAFSKLDPDSDDYSNMNIINKKWMKVVKLYGKYVLKLKSVKGSCIKSNIVVEGLHGFVARCDEFVDQVLGWYDEKDYEGVDMTVKSEATTRVRSVYLNLRGHKFNAEAMRIHTTLKNFQISSEMTESDFSKLCCVSDHPLFLLDDINVDRTEKVPGTTGYSYINDLSCIWDPDAVNITITDKKKKNIFKALRQLYLILEDIKEIFSKPDFDVKAMFSGLMNSMKTMNGARGAEPGFRLLKNYAYMFEENFVKYFTVMVEENNPARMFEMFVVDVKNYIIGGVDENGETIPGKPVERSQMASIGLLLSDLRKQLSKMPSMKQNKRAMDAMGPVMDMLMPFIDQASDGSSHKMSDEELEKNTQKMKDLVSEMTKNMGNLNMFGDDKEDENVENIQSDDVQVDDVQDTQEQA